MGTGAMVGTWMAFLALMQGAPAEPWHMRERGFTLPITAADRANVKQFFLWVSTNEGKTWEQAAVADPMAKEFPFTARTDGVHWFAISSMDKNDRLDPADIRTLSPSEKVIVVVDTRKPLVRLHAAERQAGQISVSWEVQDENLKLETMKLEYRTSESPTWYAVTVSPPTASGRKSWPASASGPIMVRLQVEDHAGNPGTAQTDLPDDSAPAPTLTTAFAPPPAAPAAPASPALPTFGGPIRPAPAAPAAPAADSPFPAHAWNQAPASPTRPVMHTTVSRANLNMSPQMPLFEASAPPPAAPAVDPGPRPIASSNNHQAGALPGVFNGGNNMNASSRPRGAAEGVNFINRTHVDLDYKISRKGPSGLGAVELWRTLNEGRSWQKFAEDRDREPPFALDLPGEGCYDLILVLRSGAGLGKQSPNPGDVPELRLEVDTTPPVASLWTPKADPSQRDKLTLVWTAEDRNLGPTPIILQWSERAGGPWTKIDPNPLQNTGSYTWTMPPDLPYQVYLRLEVTDLANNVAFAETKEPVLVDLNEPEGMLTGILAPASPPVKPKAVSSGP